MVLTRKDLSALPEQGMDGFNPGKHAQLLADLQANIIRSRGRDFSVLLFERWLADRLTQVRRWIADFAEQWVTSAQLQFAEAHRFRETGKPGRVSGLFFLSRRGYEAPDFSGSQLPSDQPFREGMHHDELTASLGDPPVSERETGDQPPRQGLVSLADDDLLHLQQTVNRITPGLRECAEILHREDGFVLRNTLGQTIEHVGYADGVSQPVFASHDIDRLRQAGETFTDWDPRAPLGLVLVKDPNGLEADSYGSCLVIRKLEQNVRLFNEDVRQLASTLAVEPELAGAYAVGRFQDGTPVSTFSSSGGNSGNDFNCASDVQGSRCPFHAHVRKTNARGDSERQLNVRDEEERGHRIAARAISYGPHRLGDEPEKNPGLLFLWFLADIANQFKFMLSRWALAADVLRVATGPDPLVGQPQGQQKGPLRWNGTETRDYGFKLWGLLKGGEYLFAPRISFLCSLAA